MIPDAGEDTTIRPTVDYAGGSGRAETFNVPVSAEITCQSGEVGRRGGRQVAGSRSG